MTRESCSPTNGYAPSNLHFRVLAHSVKTCDLPNPTFPQSISDVSPHDSTCQPDWKTTKCGFDRWIFLDLLASLAFKLLVTLFQIFNKYNIFVFEAFLSMMIRGWSKHNCIFQGVIFQASKSELWVHFYWSIISPPRTAHGRGHKIELRAFLLALAGKNCNIANFPLYWGYIW